MKIMIRNKFRRKGQAAWIAEMLTGLFAIGAVAFLYFLLYGRYFDIHAIIKSNEAKRHVINMAQVLLSSDKLVYEEEFGGAASEPIKRFHRGVFDKNKLDEQLINKDYFDAYKTITKDSDIRREVSYPQTGTNIIVYDLDSENRWVLSFGGPGLEYTGEFFTCLAQNIDDNFFTLSFNIFGPWDFWTAKACFDTYITKIGVFDKSFPVLIRDGDELHAGRLYIRIMEL